MTTLSELFPSGSGKKANFVASGNVGNGATVVLNSDGTVTAVSGQAYSAGSNTDVSPSSADETAAVYDSTNNKVAVFYDRSGSSYYRVGTVSGTSISFGTETLWLTNRNMNKTTAVYLADDNKIAVSYRDDGSGASNYGQTVLCYISGNSIFFYTPVTWLSATVSEPYIIYDSTNSRAVMLYKESTGNGRGLARAGSYSGLGNISWGSDYSFSGSETAESIAGCHDSNAGKTVISYRQSGAGGSDGCARVATVTGSLITYGDFVSFDSTATSVGVGRATVFDSTNNKVVILYGVGGSQVFGVVGTVSGTSISFGNRTLLYEGSIINDTVRFNAAAFDSVGGTIAFLIESTDAYLIFAKVNGSSLIGSSAKSVTSSYSNKNIGFQNVVYDANAEKVIPVFTASGNSSKVTCLVANSFYTNVTSDNFLGISDSAISNGSSGSVTLKGGVSENVSGLTAQTTYYVQAAGSLGAGSTDAVQAGRAISSTSINLDFNS